MKNKAIIPFFLAVLFSSYCFSQCSMNELTITTITGEWAEEMSWILVDNNNTTIGAFQGLENYNYTEYSNEYCLAEGCYIIEALDSWGDGWNDGEIQIDVQDEFGNSSNYTFSLTGNDTSIGYFEIDLSSSQNCEFIIEGCMNSSAENYNEFATVDDGSCISLEQFYATGYAGPRDYIFYKPINAAQQAPLVFVAHGYSGSAIDIMNYSGFIDLADEFGFSVCFPQGIKDSNNNAFWNVGYEFHLNETVNDVLFFTELAQYLQSTYDLATDKTFCSGMSNGGDLSYLLAFQASETFSAIGSVAGTMFGDIINNCSGTNDVSVLEIHGTNDNVTYYNGDLNDTFWGPYPGQDEIISFWVENNGCTLTESFYFPNINISDGSEVFVDKYNSPINNSKVWLYKVEEGGHDWPGSDGNMDIDASLELWKFFEQTIQNNTNVDELSTRPKILLTTIDVLGREAIGSGIVIDLFDDGTTQKRVILETQE